MRKSKTNKWLSEESPPREQELKYRKQLTRGAKEFQTHVEKDQNWAMSKDEGKHYKRKPMFLPYDKYTRESGVPTYKIWWNKEVEQKHKEKRDKKKKIARDKMRKRMQKRMRK